MRGKLTECWLAETKGIFFLIKEITRALLLIKRARLLGADWLNTSASSRFPASNGFWKGISETHRFCVWSKRGYLYVKENRDATKRSSLVKKHKDFSIQKCIDSQPEKGLSGDGWCRRKHRVTENFMAAKLKVNFFALLRATFIRSTYRRKKTAGKFCCYVKFSRWISSYRWSSFTPLQALQNRWIKLATLLEVLFIKKLLWVNWKCCVLLAIIAPHRRLSPCYYQPVL